MPSDADDNSQATLPPHVCVIGAGVCGLVSVKICLEAGLRVTCYDKSSKYGGLWCYRPDDKDLNGPFEPSVMRTTILNTSKELSSFSDFPPPAKVANFMRHSHYMNYITSYVEHFNLLAHIQLEHEIVDCQPEWELPKDTNSNGNIKWLVRVKSLKTNEIVCNKFDRLMIAVGHHNIPYQPSYTGQHKFKGQVLHSARLKDILGNETFVDKNVLVIGFGNSACDAANDIAIVANKCFVSCHRGQWFTKRFLNDGPYDFRIKSRVYTCASKLLPTCLMDRIVTRRLEQNVNHKMLGLEPRHKPSEGVPAINDLFPHRIYTGGIILKSSVATFTEQGVIFDGEDDLEHPIDVVVLATGYEAKMTFLNELELGLRSAEHNNEYDLFLNVFAPKLKLPLLNMGQQQQEQQPKQQNNNSIQATSVKSIALLTQNGNDADKTDQQQQHQQQQQQTTLPSALPTPIEAIKSLAFIGLVQPNGSMTVISELQARYAALVFAGQRELPKMRDMLRHMDRVRKMRSKAIRSHSRDQLIGNYVGYMDTISALIGVKPNLAKLFFSDNKLWRHLTFGPCVPYQYRLTGPGYWPEARKTVLTTKERVYSGINEGNNHILYKSRRKRLDETNKIVSKTTK